MLVRVRHNGNIVAGLRSSGRNFYVLFSPYWYEQPYSSF
jgi:hypothetical protein